MEVIFNAYYEMKYSAREEFYGRSDYSTWCRNHVFTPHNIGEKVYMVDTFWGGKEVQSNSFMIEWTEENAKYFDFIAHFDSIKEINDNEREQYGYENILCIKTGGAGSSDVKYFVSKDIEKSVEYTINQINEKIDNLNRQIQICLDAKRRIAEEGKVPKWLYF